MKKLFLMLLVCLAALSASADESVGLSYKVTGDSTVEVFRLNIRNVSVVTIPQTVTGDSTTYTVTSIGDYAFDGCYSLTSVTIPNSVTSIGEFAFSNCSALTSVTLPNSITSIGYQAFSGCCALISITIPDSVISIGDGAFEGTPLYYNKANWHDKVLYIGNHLIKAMCKGSYTIKAGTRTIADDAFDSCNIKSVTIPNSVISIGAGAFSSCENLKSVTIPNSVKSIGATAFACCFNLKSVTIPNSVTTIGNGVFVFCEKLKTITVENNNPANISLGTEVFKEVPTSTCVLQVPAGAKSLYAAADQWKEFVHIEQ